MKILSSDYLILFLNADEAKKFFAATRADKPETKA